MKHASSLAVALASSCAVAFGWAAQERSEVTAPPQRDPTRPVTRPVRDPAAPQEAPTSEPLVESAPIPVLRALLAVEGKPAVALLEVGSQTLRVELGSVIRHGAFELTVQQLDAELVRVLDSQGRETVLR